MKEELFNQLKVSKKAKKEREKKEKTSQPYFFFVSLSLGRNP
jgi:hypothetical protein